MAQIKFFRGTRANYNTDSQGTKQTEVLNEVQGQIIPVIWKKMLPK